MAISCIYIVHTVIKNADHVTVRIAKNEKENESRMFGRRVRFVPLSFLFVSLVVRVGGERERKKKGKQKNKKERIPSFFEEETFVNYVASRKMIVYNNLTVCVG